MIEHYDCTLCGVHTGTKDESVEHVKQKHPEVWKAALDAAKAEIRKKLS